jgi:hypothetical protein
VVISRGSKTALLAGYAFILPAFLLMLIGWREGAHFVVVGLAYLLIGIGGRHGADAGIEVADGLGTGLARGTWPRQPTTWSATSGDR